MTSRNGMLADWRGILATHPAVLLPQRDDPLLEGRRDLRSVEHLRPCCALRAERDDEPARAAVGRGADRPRRRSAHRVQIVAAWHREDLCLDVAAAVEAHCGTLVEQLWRRMV